MCDTGDDAALAQLAEYLYARFLWKTRHGEGAALVLELNPKGRLLELHPEAAFTPGGELRFSPYLDGHNHAERSVHISRRCVKENISSAYAATKVLTDMGILKYARWSRRTPWPLTSASKWHRRQWND